LTTFAIGAASGSKQLWEDISKEKLTDVGHVYDTAIMSLMLAEKALHYFSNADQLAIPNEVLTNNSTEPMSLLQLLTNIRKYLEEAIGDHMPPLDDMPQNSNGAQANS